MKPATRNSYSVDRSSTQIEGVKVGKIACLNEDYSVCVDFNGNTTKNLKARVVKSLDWNSLLSAAENQQELLLTFEDGNSGKPIIIDILTTHTDTPVVTPVKSQEEKLSLGLLDREAANKTANESDALQDVTVDGKRISFNAQDQIVLQCGKSSITLTKAGKVIIKGAYLLNRSSGALRIKGGSVQIN